MSTADYIISFIGGAFAGMLNTMAGFGSIITLAIYMDMMGIAGHIANATNRVNILASSSISTVTFIKHGKLNITKSGWVIAVVLVGAILGVFLATKLDDQGFKSAFNYMLIPVLIILLANPKRFISPDTESKPSSRWILVPILFLIGIYAGFIQVGFGVLFLMVLVILAKQDLIKSNAIKVAVVMVYTIIALIYFHLEGMVNWKAGIALAAGQALGGYLAAVNASKLEGANKWAYRLLVAIVILVIIKNFELYKIFM